MSGYEDGLSVLGREGLAGTRGAGLEDDGGTLGRGLADVGSGNLVEFSDVVDGADELRVDEDARLAVKLNGIVPPG